MLPRADAHIHLFRNGFAGRYGRSPAGAGDEVEAYETLRSVHNIAAALVVGYQGDGIDPANNDYIRNLAASRDWMTTVAFVPPGDIVGPGRIAELLARGHRGLALYLTDVEQAAAILGWSSETWSLLEDARALLSLNVGRAALPAVATMAAAHEACSFAVSHLGDPGSFRTPPALAVAAERMAPLLDLARQPNAFVKISGLYAISEPPHDYPHRQASPFVELALDAFGARRCLWGSDFSPALDHVSFSQTVDVPQLAGLAQEEREQIMGGNLLGLLARPGR